MTEVLAKIGEHCCLSVVGHAGAGPYGGDIVCAAVSTLCNALTVVVSVMAEAGHCREPQAEAREGEFYLFADGCDGEVQDLFSGFILMFSRLPGEYVRVKK